MKTQTSFLAVLALVSTSPLLAQDPVVGVDDPESLFVDDDPEIHRNKQAALHIMRELLQCDQWDRAGEWITDRYIQHNPNAANGLDAVVQFFTEVLGRDEPTEDCNELTTPVVAVVAEDDYVTVVIPREYENPRTGETYTTTWFDMWRFVDGKADEHWDPATIAAPSE